MGIIVCYLIDLSDFIATIKQVIWKWLFKNKQYQEYSLRPFDCSLCMCHHILLLYLLFSGNFSIINYCIVCLISFLSSNITGFLIVLKDALIVAENYFSNLLNKK